MKRKTILGSITGFSLIFLVGAMACFSLGNISSFKAEENSLYTLTFDSTKNKLTEQTTYTTVKTVQTELDSKANKITFTAAGVKNCAEGWQEFQNGGYFQNTDHIVGMDSLTLKGTSDSLQGVESKATIYYSKDFIDANKLESYDFKEITFPANSTYEGKVMFDKKPNYIYTKFTNNDVKINSAQIVINNECREFTNELKIEVNDEKMGSAVGAGKYYDGDDVTLTAIANDGYHFIGWYLNNISISSTSTTNIKMPNYPITYQVKFGPNSYNVSIKNDEMLGKVTGAGNYDFGTNVTLTATPNEGYKFDGWYANGELLHSSNSYSFIMGNNPLEIETKYYVEYGLYPQSNVTDESLISILNKKIGALPTKEDSQNWNNYASYYVDDKGHPLDNKNQRWYKDIKNDNGEEYRAVYMLITPELHNNGYKVENVYYFKFEPIKWLVLDNNGFVCSKYSLDANQNIYHNSRYVRTIDNEKVYPNNYKESNMRKWLNSTFLTEAFTVYEQNNIKTTVVDNSGTSAGYSDHLPSACANTNDKMFLLSYKELFEMPEYGFNSNASRKASATDYAKCMGCGVEDGYSNYWTRSPTYDYSYDCTRGIMANGDYSSFLIYGCGFGVRPALTLKK